MGSGPDFDSFTVAVSDGQVSTPVTVKVAVLPAVIPSIGTTAQTGATPMGMAVSPTKTYVANQGLNTVLVVEFGEPDGRAGDDQSGVLAAGDRVEPRWYARLRGGQWRRVGDQHGQ